MRALSSSELLDAWEQGQGQPAFRRALFLLAAACPERPPAELAALPIGRRDGLLLSLRELAFGTRISAVATCPACGERLDLQFETKEIRSAPPALPDGEPLTLRRDGWEACFRLPDSLDLAALASCASLEEARWSLLGRCVTEAMVDGTTVDPAALPEPAASAIETAMAEADPQAEVRLGFACAACGHEWAPLFDVVQFLWSEVDAWARGLLRDVHALASAYGWTEEEILALSPFRRQAYLELARG